MDSHSPAFGMTILVHSNNNLEGETFGQCYCGPCREIGRIPTHGNGHSEQEAFVYIFS